MDYLVVNKIINIGTDRPIGAVAHDYTMSLFSYSLPCLLFEQPFLHRHKLEFLFTPCYPISFIHIAKTNRLETR